MPRKSNRKSNKKSNKKILKNKGGSNDQNNVIEEGKKFLFTLVDTLVNFHEKNFFLIIANNVEEVVRLYSQSIDNGSDLYNTSEYGVRWENRLEINNLELEINSDESKILEETNIPYTTYYSTR